MSEVSGERGQSDGQEARAKLAAELSERLSRALGVENGVLSGAACVAYSVQGRSPAVVARPRDTDGVAAALAVAAELGAAVVPWGGGSRSALGYPPRRYDLALSLERLTSVLAHDPADLTVTVQAGISHAALAAALARADQLLPLDAPLPARATIGGTLATGTAGLRRAFYGGPRDLALGLRIVDAHGTPLKTGGRVVKNVTGYDMTKLYTGSLGTLGVIVEASFKLMPRPDAEVTVLGSFARPSAALACAEPLDALAVRPSAVVAVQVDAIPELAALAPTHREHVLVAARFPGTVSAVKRAEDEGRTILREAGGRGVLSLDDVAQQTFWAALDDFAQTAARASSSAALLRVSVLPLECATVLEVAQTLAGEHGLGLTWLADAASGTVWLRLRGSGPTGGAGASGAGDADDTANAVVAVQESLTHRWRSSVVLDCDPGLKSRLPVWGADPSALDLMREVKQSFDPEHRLNPGRFIAGI